LHSRGLSNASTVMRFTSFTASTPAAPTARRLSPLAVRLSIAVAAVALCAAVRAQGAVQPSPADVAAQEQRRLLEREDTARRQQERPRDLRLPEPARSADTLLPQAETPCFPISDIRFDGDDDGRLRWRLGEAIDGSSADSPIGRCLGAEGVAIVQRRVQNALLAAGFVTTRVLAEPQDLRTGVLTLTVFAGRIGSIKSDASTSRVTLFNALPAGPGDLLNLRDIEQALENLKRVPSVDADIRIEATEVSGVSDLVVTSRQGTPVRLGLTLDDAGSRATGRVQAAATVSYDNWWTLNDLFYVTMNRDLHHPTHAGSGSQGGTLHYSVPFGYWLIGSTWSRSGYRRMVAGPYENVVYSGVNRNVDIKLSRLVHRDGSRKTTLSIKAFQRLSSSYVDDNEIEVQRRVVGGWEAGLHHRQFLGAVTADLAMAYRRGTGAFGALPAPEESFGEGTSRPEIGTVDLNVDVPNSSLADLAGSGPEWLATWLRQSGVRYSVNWRAQWNRTALTPQDRFAIGGRYTVRGFDGEGSLVGDRGWLIRNDVVIPVTEGLDAFIGIDCGRIGGRSAEFVVGKALAGGVLGLRGAIEALHYELSLGAPLSKPDGFATAGVSAGFNLNYAF
jgi:hemolysin activation/secretion protein